MRGRRRTPAAAPGGWPSGPDRRSGERGRPANSSNGGGYLSCPANTAALTGGAHWRRPGKDLEHSVGAGAISSSTVTSDAAGWYAAGQSSGDGHRLTTVIQ
jgi:hypothetical protein